MRRRIHERESRDRVINDLEGRRDRITEGGRACMRRRIHVMWGDLTINDLEGRRDRVTEGEGERGRERRNQERERILVWEHILQRAKRQREDQERALASEHVWGGGYMSESAG
jgi:hypothetical protein